MERTGWFSDGNEEENHPGCVLRLLRDIFLRRSHPSLR
jgi:hypothetical protein